MSQLSACIRPLLTLPDEEIKAVDIMHAALQDTPHSYPVLHAQCDFLMSKGKHEWAQEVAQQAVNAAPSEFVTWAKLSEAYIELGQFDKALLTLNSCPMFTFNERDLHRMPTPLKTHLPVKKFVADSGILDEESSRDNEADVALLRLPAPGLRGTFAKAYALLTLLVSKIGWDELLKTRSKVFVMEEEYRAHKQTTSLDMNGAADDSASITGVRSPPRTPTDIPTIRISTESSRNQANGKAVEHARQPSVTSIKEETGEEEEGSPTSVPTVEVEKPAEAHGVQDADPAQNQVLDGEEEVSAFSNKRLCERWLDNLFLRVRLSQRRLGADKVVESCTRI